MAKAVVKSKKSPLKRDEKIQRAAKAAARTAVLAIKKDEEEELHEEIEFGGDEPSEETSFSLDDAQEEIADKTAGHDLFIDVGERLAEAGEAPKYVIYKNHQLLVSVDHPYSWEQLQREYGGGFYKVQCRSSATGRYKGQDTKILATPPGWRSPLVASGEPTPEPGVSRNDEFMKLMTFMRESTKDEKEEAKKGESQMTTLLAAIITSMKPNDTTTQMMTFITDMNKTQMSVLDKINEANLRMFEKLNDKIDKMGDKDKGMTVAETLKMYHDADDRATKREDRVRALSKQIAEELADKGTEPKSESTVDTILKNLLPVLAAGASAQMAKPPVQPQVQPPPQRQLSPNEIRMLEQRRKTAPVSSPAGVTVTGPATPVTGVAQIRRPGGIPLKTKVPAAPVAEKEPVLSKKETIMQVAMPIIANSLEKNVNAADCSKAVITTLTQVGITQDDVRANFTWADIEAIVKQYGVPQVYFQYLKEFFDAMVSPAQTIQLPANDSHPRADA